MIRIVFTDNTDLPENRQKYPDCLRKNKAGEAAVTYSSGASSASVSVLTDPADLPEHPSACSFWLYFGFTVVRSMCLNGVIFIGETHV